MEHPDVRLDVRTEALDERDRREAPGKDIRAVAWEWHPVHSSHSAALPWIVIDRGAAATISPPTRSWMRIQGSKCDPSPRRHSTYVSIGMSG
jgi:hypothetical protein